MKHSNNVPVDKQLYTEFCTTLEQYDLLAGIEKIIFLFSGGKDATLGLYFLDKYIQEKGIKVEVEALMIAYPKHVYYLEDDSIADCFIETKKFWKEKHVNLVVCDSDKSDFEDDGLGACKICKSARKEIVDEYLSQVDSTKTAVVTGYTLYDALAYMDEICLVSNYDFNNISTENTMVMNRINNCLHKMKIKEVLPNGLTIIRPLITMKEDMIMDTVIKLQLPYIGRGCRAANFKHKREYFKVLNIASPINNTTYEGLLEFLKKINIALPMSFEDIELGNYFTDC